MMSGPFFVLLSLFKYSLKLLILYFLYYKTKKHDDEDDKDKKDVKVEAHSAEQAKA